MDRYYYSSVPNYMAAQHNSNHPLPPTRPPAVAVAPSHGVHLFEVADYSRHRDLAVHSFLRSTTFDVGGCAWSLRFYPNGDGMVAGFDGYVAVAVELMTREALVSVLYDLRLVEPATGARYSALEGGRAVFDTRGPAPGGSPYLWYSSQFMSKDELEESAYLRDDRIVIECTIRVLHASRAPDLPPAATVDAPPPCSDLSPDHLGRLLKEGEGADVTFNVRGKSFAAHRILLAARSPVFRAQLLGPMKEGRAARVAVREIRPQVFEALLHFAYTDSFPPMDDDNDDGGEALQMMRDLLVAADRYAMDRLKHLCEQTLSRILTVENVSTTAVLANRYNCSQLKDACSDFMMSKSNRTEDVTATEGYAGLKRHHPDVLIELLEKAVKLRKIRGS